MRAEKHQVKGRQMRRLDAVTSAPAPFFAGRDNRV
jgi:hypothetical protein